MASEIKQLQVSRRFVNRYLLAVIALGLIHHVDHALRWDHSGWPIRGDTHVPGAGIVTPFTYSLLIYPVLLSMFFVGNKVYRIVAGLAPLALVLWAHLTIEPVPHIYRTWADNRVPGGTFEGFPNLLNLGSPAVGGLAVGLLFVLGLALAVLPFLIWREEPASRGTAAGAASRRAS
ncbi:hypothetical protein ABGB18_11740 [Nonomuraea sp. B12E4]|uniref:hypothetical protein n=1 Tax=Nonomuraea sp. B12E4 TaxID=3153564 RepID=UPI00325C60CE